MYKKSLFAISALAMISTSSLASEKIDDLVVSAKSNKSVKDLSGTITVITKEDIEKVNATTIKDILVRTAGIVEGVNSSSSYGRKNISIRGSLSRHVLILVDGKKVNPTDNYIGHTDYQYNWVPVQSIERIEVIKGPKSSIYGSQAIGGVINIITKKTKEKFYGDVDIKMGVSAAKEGGDERRFGVNLGGQVTDKLSVIVGANYDERKEVRATRSEFDFGSFSYKDNPNATSMEGIESKNLRVKLNYDIDDTQNVSASYVRGEENRRLFDNPDYYSLTRSMYDISYQKKFKDLSLDLSYAVADSDSHIDHSIFNYIHNLTDTSLKAESKISMLKNNYIVMGAETSKEEYVRNYKTTGQKRFDYDLRTNAYYIQDEIELGNLIVTLGARIDDHENFGNHFSPTAAAVYKINENHRIKASYGEGFQSPSTLQGSSAYLNAGYGIQGNDDLKPETSKSYEVAYEYYGEASMFKVAAYSTEVEDLIATGPSTTGATKNQYLNVDEATMKGVEVEVEYEINDNHVVNANYNYLKTEDKSDGKDIAFKPKNTFNLGISSELGNGFSSYLSANHIGSQYDTSDKKVASYTLYNFQLAKKIDKNATLRVGMDNIGDKEFKDGEPYELKRRLTYVGFNYKF